MTRQPRHLRQPQPPLRVHLYRRAPQQLTRLWIPLHQQQLRRRPARRPAQRRKPLPPQPHHLPPRRRPSALLLGRSVSLAPTAGSSLLGATSAIRASRRPWTGPRPISSAPPPPHPLGARAPSHPHVTLQRAATSMTLGVTAVVLDQGGLACTISRRQQVLVGPAAGHGSLELIPNGFTALNMVGGTTSLILKTMSCA